MHVEIIRAELRARADKRFRRLDKEFGDAVRSRRRSAITEVLQRAQLSEDLARRTAERILATVRRERNFTAGGRIDLGSRRLGLGKRGS